MNLAIMRGMPRVGQTWQHRDGRLVRIDGLRRRGAVVEFIDLQTHTGYEREIDSFLSAYRLV